MNPETGAPSPPPGRLTPARGCALALLLALLPALLGLAVAVLAVQGEIVLGRGGLTETRLWLVRESGSAGIGASASRIVRGGADSSTACVETQVRFLLWRADGSLPRAEYCECFERAADSWELRGPCP